MPNLVSAYSGDDGNTVVSVSEGFAKARNLKTLKEPATDVNGRPLSPREGHRTTTAKTAAADASTTTNGGSTASKEGS